MEIEIQSAYYYSVATSWTKKTVPNPFLQLICFRIETEREPAVATHAVATHDLFFFFLM